jgi:hypothetical protein
MNVGEIPTCRDERAEVNRALVGTGYIVQPYRRSPDLTSMRNTRVVLRMPEKHSVLARPGTRRLAAKQRSGIKTCNSQTGGKLLVTNNIIPPS